jgi:4-hydroxy-tetrahydrodipicolinate synthase
VGQPELTDYYLQIASQMPLPVVPYNMPSCTKVQIELNTLRLLLDHPNVVAYKDSSGQMVYLHRVIQLLKQYPGKTVLVGPEEMLGETTLLGGNGGVSGGANLFPGLYVALYEAAKSNDLVEVQRLHGLVMQVSTLLYGVGKYGSSTIKGIKCALSCLGICEGNMADPFQHFHAHERDIIRERVSTISEHLASDKG